MNVFPQTEINIEALENVKTRLFQLQESILFFLRSINPETTPSTVSWYLVASMLKLELY